MKKWKIWTAFLTVFAAGILVGMAGLGLVLKHHFAPPENPAEFHRHIQQRMLEDFLESVQPDPSAIPAIQAVLNQVFEELNAIRDATRPRLEMILKNGEKRIKTHLTPEQAARFDRMIKERRRGGPGFLRLPPPPPPLP